MKIRVPDYFVDFRCIADRCKDSCCIGWEIDIDDDARRKYEALDTPLGREIREKTSHGFFTLQENGRCAFLDEGGLCRIISSVGEGYLCDICREHPRYYGVGGKGIEGGLGLSCEEAARIILSLRKLPRIIEIERDVPYLDEDEFAILGDSFRELLTESLFESDIRAVIGKYIAYASVAEDIAFDTSTSGKCVSIPKPTYLPAEESELKDLLLDCLDIFSECEALTDEWYVALQKARAVRPDDLLAMEKTIKALLYYFTHRYIREGIEDMSLGGRVLFALGSALVIAAISLVTYSEENDIKAAVMFSKNIEYSTDNVDYFLNNIDFCNL